MSAPLTGPNRLGATTGSTCEVNNPVTTARLSRIRRHLLTLSDAAAEVGVSERTLRRYISQGRLDVIRINARVLRIDPAELDRFLGVGA